jgi:uncharacterized protein (TIGR03663 family)
MFTVKDNSLNARETLYFFSIILVGLFLRWYGLSDRPYHHDESLHAVYGAYNYFHPDTLYYKYTALLHGPLMYKLIPYFYEIFGANLFSARVLIALIGSAFLFVPWLFREHFSKNIFLALTSFVAVSPLLVYYSRFLREDFLVLSSLLGMIFAVTNAPTKYKGGLFFIFLSLHYCVKENVFITMAMGLGYLFYDALLAVTNQKVSNLKQILNYFKENLGFSLLGLAIAIFIFCYYYSAQFRNPELILNGLYKDSLLYWLNQHHIERIKGPFSFQFLIITFYDFYFMIFMAFISLHMIMTSKTIEKSIALLILFIGFILAYTAKETTFENWLWQFFKLKIKLDIFWLFAILLMSLFTTTIHWLKEEKHLAWFSYLFWGTFFSYSYVGEKVPWLSLYPLLFGMIYISLYFQHNFRSFIVNRFHYFIFTLVLLFTIRICLITNYDRAGSATELISQVHTSKQFHQIVKTLKDKMNSPIKKELSTLITGDAVWPSTWYFFNEQDFHFFNQKENSNQYRYIIQNEFVETLDKTHDRHHVKLRGWWVPNYELMNTKNVFQYVLAHQPWNESGYSFVYFYIKK